MPRLSHFLFFFAVTFLFLSSGKIVLAVHTKYTDSGLSCEQTSGKVLCLKRFNDSYGAMNVVFKVPKEISDQFPPSAADVEPGAQFHPAIVYERGAQLLKENCVGGYIITEIYNDNMCAQTKGARSKCNFIFGPRCFSGCLSTGYYPTVEIGHCPVLDSVTRLSVSSEQIEESGSYTVSWSSSNPRIECQLTGKMPDNYSASSVSGSNTFFNVPRGIYTNKFTCTGVLDGANSTAVGKVAKTAIVRAGNIPPPPSVDLKAEPAVIKKGESAILSWSSQNVISASINQGIGVVVKQGTLKVSPGLTTRYVITASGEFAELGLARKSVTVRVLAPEIPGEKPLEEAPPEEKPAEPPAPPAPKLDLKVDGKDGPITVGAPATLTLSWNLDKYCLAYGSWIGIKTKAGSETRTEKNPGTYTYRLYCPTVGSDEVVVRVTGKEGAAAVSLPRAEASASLDGKNFSKSIRVVRGEKVKMWLSAKNSRDETGGWTGLMSFGGRCEWNADLNQGIPTFEAAVADPKNAQDCAVALDNLTFYDQPGVYRYGILRLAQNNGKLSNIGYLNIVVQEPPPPKGPPEIDLKINNLDGPVTLGAPAEYLVSWNVRNADTCLASGAWGGDKFLAGSQRFVASEKKEFTYTLTCGGKLGTTQKSILLKVSELPVCDFSALPLTLSQSVFDRQSVLSWRCQFANSCEISPAVGQVATFGSVRVSPKTTATYTLTCQNLEGVSSFDQVVEVK